MFSGRELAVKKKKIKKEDITGQTVCKCGGMLENKRAVSEDYKMCKDCGRIYP